MYTSKTIFLVDHLRKWLGKTTNEAKKQVKQVEPVKRAELREFKYLAVLKRAPWPRG